MNLSLGIACSLNPRVSFIHGKQGEVFLCHMARRSQRASQNVIIAINGINIAPISLIYAEPFE